MKFSEGDQDRRRNVAVAAFVVAVYALGAVQDSGHFLLR